MLHGLVEVLAVLLLHDPGGLVRLEQVRVGEAALVVLGLDAVGLLGTDVRELLLAQQHGEVLGRVLVQPHPRLAVLGQVHLHPGLALERLVQPAVDGVAHHDRAAVGLAAALEDHVMAGRVPALRAGLAAGLAVLPDGGQLRLGELGGHRLQVGRLHGLHGVVRLRVGPLAPTGPARPAAGGEPAREKCGTGHRHAGPDPDSAVHLVLPHEWLLRAAPPRGAAARRYCGRSVLRSYGAAAAVRRSPRRRPSSSRRGP